MNEEFERGRHILKLENREGLEMSGVKDVGAFNEEEISAVTTHGGIIIKGEGLHIDELNLETGKLKISGNIGAFVYNDKTDAKSFWGRLFA